MTLAGASAAQAQTLEPPRARQGYYLALGLNLYATQQWDHSRSEGVTQGSLYTLRLGQMLTRRWGLGLRFEVGSGKADGQTRGVGGLGLEVQFNPIRDLALHAGVGMGFDSVDDPRNVEEPLRGGYGAMGLLGATWDLFLTRRLTGGWSLAPTVMVHFLPSDTLRGVWVSAGVQISWWSGRPRNELVLPESEAYKK
jgi:hypothetical protein